MNFIVDIEPLLQSICIKKTNYSDRKKCESFENITNGYSIIRYDKSLIDMKVYDNVKTIGHLRSVVVSKEGGFVSYSPPKSTQWDDFVENMEDFRPVVEEYVEGTMINMFWDEFSSSWEYSTKNTIGCKSHYQHIDFDIYNQPKKQFITMFLDAFFYNFVNFINFDKSCCYSFVLQHPENRIVGVVQEPQLYLVACYKITDKCVFYMDMDHIRSQVNDMIREKMVTRVLRFPVKYEFTTIDEIKQTYGCHSDYNVMGVVIKNPNTGEYAKLRNKTYEQVKKLTGNHTSLLHKYITLSKSGQLQKYLEYYPEHHSQYHYYYYILSSFAFSLETYIKRILSGGSINDYFTRGKSHHVNMVYHLKQLNELFIQNNTLDVTKYISEMEMGNLYYALKQFNRFITNDV